MPPIGRLRLLDSASRPKIVRHLWVARYRPRGPLGSIQCEFGPWIGGSTVSGPVGNFQSRFHRDKARP
jgi:hypothetical protein